MKKYFMTLSQVQEAIGFRKTVIYKWMKEDSFPKQIVIGKCARWVSTDVEAWMEEQIKRRKK